MPERIEVAECYEIPRFGPNTEKEFSNAGELMDYLEVNTEEEHCIYWRNKNEGNVYKMAMVFYNTDGSVVFGISSFNE